jgi:hypothetical protein
MSHRDSYEIFLIGNAIRWRVMAYAPELIWLRPPYPYAIGSTACLQVIFLSTQYAVAGAQALLVLSLMPVWRRGMPASLRQIAQLANTRLGFQLLVSLLPFLSFALFYVCVGEYANLVVLPSSAFQSFKVGTAGSIAIAFLLPSSILFTLVALALVRAWINRKSSV